jgi:hypothetical protein
LLNGLAELSRVELVQGIVLGQTDLFPDRPDLDKAHAAQTALLGLLASPSFRRR